MVFTNFCLFFYKSHQVSAPHGAVGPNLKYACSTQGNGSLSLSLPHLTGTKHPM